MLAHEDNRQPKTCFRFLARSSMEGTMAQIPFEVPQQLREMTEQNIRQLNSAYSQVTDTMNQAMNSWFAALPSNAMTQSLKTVQERTAEFAKKNADAAFALANDVAKAKSLQEVLTLQTEYAQQQFQNFTAQTQELAKLASSAAQNFNKS